MPITHGWTTAASDNPAYDVSAGELNAHTGSNDHAHTATADGGVLTSPEVSAKLLLNEQGSDPASPASTKWVLYVKSGGVYAKNSAGTVVGPLAAGGASFATPTIALGSAAAAGAASTSIRSDSTIAAFDATAPTTQALGDAAAVGSAAFAARRDHKHGMPALGTTAAAVGTSAGGSATTPSKSDHVHATGAGTPSTQAFGDAAATGSGPAAAMTDHKHAMPALPAIDATGAATDITTRNVSTTAHGLTPKLPNDATKYLDGTGAYTIPPAASGMTDPMTTRGDIIIRNASNVTARLGHGTAGQVLGTDGTDVAWAAGSSSSFVGAKAYKNGTQSMTGSGTEIVLFDTEDYDTSAFHDNSTNTGRMTVPSTGYYALKAHVYSASAFNADWIFRVNGSALYSDIRISGVAGNGITFSTDLKLTAGDYVELVYVGSAISIGHATLRQAQNDLSIFLIGS